MSEPGRSPEPASATRLALGIGILFGLGLLAAAQIPHAWGVYNQWQGEHPELVYSGAPTTYADEAATYWSWMGQARDGRLFMEDLMTPEDHPRNYVNIFFYTLGTIARLGNWSVEGTYAAARVGCGALLVFVLALFARALFDSAPARLAALLSFLLASGWEGLLAFIGNNFGGRHVSSPAWWMPEISTFFSFMIFPHFLAGFAAMIGCLLFLLRAWQRGPAAGAGRPASARAGLPAALGAGLLMAGITFFHPYDVIPVFIILWLAPLLFALTERRLAPTDWVPSIVASAVWLPAFAYNYAIFLNNPAMRAWDLQNIMGTPEPMRLVIVAGLNGVLALVPLAATGLALLPLPHRPVLERRHLVLVAWLVGVLVTIHLPLRFQRRMMGGMQYPLAGLAVLGLGMSIETWRRLLPIHRRAPLGAGLAVATGAGRRLLLVVLVLLPLQGLTPYYLLDREWRWMKRLAYPAWLESETVQAFDWLRAGARPGSRVLAAYEIGNFVPAKTGLRAVLGHYALSMDAPEKREAIRRFHGDEVDDAFRFGVLRRWQVSYLMSTPFERRLGPFEPGGRPWLREVFRAGEGERRTVVYEVVLPGPG